MTSSNMQPAAEFSDGMYYHQQHGTAKWIETDRDGLLAALASDHPPAFRSILAANSCDEDGRPTRLSGPYYVDLDGADEDLAFVIGQFHKLLAKLRDHSVNLNAVRLYLTGGRGMHIEIPQSMFLGKVPPDGIWDLDNDGK